MYEASLSKMISLSFVASSGPDELQMVKISSRVVAVLIESVCSCAIDEIDITDISIIKDSFFIIFQLN
ncbi:MAG: hypothetical protein HC831_02340 [Chloroflexia bacterium]|nr:hypothetical protein [Chloroflexia bacterium]